MTLLRVTNGYDAANQIGRTVRAMCGPICIYDRVVWIWISRSRITKEYCYLVCGKLNPHLTSQLCVCVR
jgi:hypothetical protein